MLPQETENIADKTLEFTILPEVSGIVINSETGEISVRTDAEPINQEFTITAAGIGDYKGTIKTTIRIVVYRSIKGSLSYDAISILPGGSGFQEAKWTNGDIDQTVSYSISPSIAGVSVDGASGRVSVDSSASLMDQDFTITASGTGVYGGQIEGTIHVNVQKNDIGGTFQYDEISLLLGESGYKNPQWAEEKQGQNIELQHFAQHCAGVSVDNASGRVSISPSAGIMDKVFTVTAIGFGDYAGSISGTIHVEVRRDAISGSLRFSDIVVEFGNEGFQNPPMDGGNNGADAKLQYFAQCFRGVGGQFLRSGQCRFQCGSNGSEFYSYSQRNWQL